MIPIKIRRLAVPAMWAMWTLTAALAILRFCWLRADFPNGSPWLSDQAKFTDEGWWAQAAVMHHILGHWNIPGDYNPGIATPIWPAILAALFHLTGVSFVAARALSVALSLATVALVYLLVQRYTEGSRIAPSVAALVLAASPFAFVFSRLAILESAVLFEFALALLLASFSGSKRSWSLAALAILIPAMILTKTTSAILLPAVFWLIWCSSERKVLSLLRAAVAVVVIPAILLKLYLLLVNAQGYSGDYSYFFEVNAIEEMDWSQTIPTLRDLAGNLFWVDRVLYPAGAIILAISLVWWRGLWRNPLYTASWLTIFLEAAYIFRRQDDYAPRYFLMLLIPLVLVVVIALHEWNRERSPSSGLLPAVVAVIIVAALAANLTLLTSLYSKRQYQFADAAASIAHIIQTDSRQKPLILGVSGSQLSLMTGVPSINDAYGSEDLSKKVALYQPGWYVAWNGVGEDIQSALERYSFQPIASYHVFDDDDRNQLILYRLVERPDPL